MSLSTIIKQSRLDHQITQAELAKRLGVARSYICKIESNHCDYEPSRRFVKRLAQVLGMDERELLLRSGRLPEGMESAIAASVLNEL